MSSRRPPNPSPLRDCLEICSTMSYSLLFAAHKGELVDKDRGLWEVPFISVKWLFHCPVTMVSHTTERARSQQRRAMPSCKTFLPWSTEHSLFLSKLLFSAMKSVCKWYYFDSSGNHLGAKKRGFLIVRGESSNPHPAWPVRVALDLKELFCQSYLLRVTLIRIKRTVAISPTTPC